MFFTKWDYLTQLSDFSTWLFLNKCTIDYTLHKSDNTYPLNNSRNNVLEKGTFDEKLTNGILVPHFGQDPLY